MAEPVVIADWKCDIVAGGYRRASRGFSVALMTPEGRLDCDSGARIPPEVVAWLTQSLVEEKEADCAQLLESLDKAHAVNIEQRNALSEARKMADMFRERLSQVGAWRGKPLPVGVEEDVRAALATPRRWITLNVPETAEERVGHSDSKEGDHG